VSLISGNPCRPGGVTTLVCDGLRISLHLGAGLPSPNQPHLHTCGHTPLLLHWDVTAGRGGVFPLWEEKAFCFSLEESRSTSLRAVHLKHSSFYLSPEPLL